MSDRGAAMRRRDVRRHPVERAPAPLRGGHAQSDAGAPATAGYIADMTAQLESMAAATGLELLAYFLAMARAEGEAAARGDASAEREQAKSD